MEEKIASPEQVIMAMKGDWRKAGMSYQDVAEKTGYKSPTIANMASSRKKYLSYNQAIAFRNAFGYNISFLMFGEGSLYPEEPDVPEFLKDYPGLARDLREAAALLPRTKYRALSQELSQLADTVSETQEDNISEKCYEEQGQKVWGLINHVILDVEDAQADLPRKGVVPSCYTALDRVTLGFEPGELIVVASYPSVGKSAFVHRIARNLAVEKEAPVALFTLEAAADQVAARIVATETGLPKDRLFYKKMTQQQWGQLHNGVSRILYSPLFIDDTPALPIYEFVRRARKMVRENGIKLFIIDGMQLMEAPRQYFGVREQEVTSICRILKETAMELKVPIVVTSHINRVGETRGGTRRPQLSYLRESGAIEQIADIVMFIHRPEFMGTQEEGGFPGETDLIIAKNRNGETCDIKMRFLASEVRFVDYNDIAYSGESVTYTASRLNSMVDENASPLPEPENEDLFDLDDEE